jgi:hypothetical protein
LKIYLQMGQSSPINTLQIILTVTQHVILRQTLTNFNRPTLTNFNRPDDTHPTGHFNWTILQPIRVYFLK